MKPIYTPKARAKEYGDLAINIYAGCTHGCVYCFAPKVLHKDRGEFHSQVEPRADIVESVKRQLDREQIKDKLIHLCFTCDPYPLGIDTTPTREIIKAIKESGNHVQILTKGSETRDFDLLDKNDWFGITISSFNGLASKNEPNAATPIERLLSLIMAKNENIKTWVSCEPVYEPIAIYELIEIHHDKIDKFKIGKLNYFPSDINWGEFGRECERLCKMYGVDYYLKEDLRKEIDP